MTAAGLSIHETAFDRTMGAQGAALDTGSASFSGDAPDANSEGRPQSRRAGAIAISENDFSGDSFPGYMEELWRWRMKPPSARPCTLPRKTREAH